MRLLLKLALSVFLVVILVIIGILAWFFFYQGDLPDVGLLAQFAPDAPGVAPDPCLSLPITVVPAREIAQTIEVAIKATESETNRPFQVARSLICGWERHGNLTYAMDQYRLVWRIRQRFPEDQMLTIYMNRVYFGEDTFGVADASRHYFSKKPNNLTIAEAAFLAGIIKAPSRLSPQKYPDLALQRRNQVTEAMRIQGVISAADASKAEATPLGVRPQSPQ